MKNFRTGLRATCAALALMAGAMVAAPAAAQDGATAVEEIVVVAQKRQENIQDVPISVSAVAGERLDTAFAGGADILALSSRVPGLNVESSNGRAAPRFYIRGLGNTDFDLAASQPVSVVMDDVVMENVTLKSFPLFDIRQVEVSRGPQGTLFGRNTTAGIVNIISERPTDAFEAIGSLSYGTHGTASAEGAISGPVAGDTMLGRASIMYKRRDDWIDNTFAGPGPHTDEIGGYEDFAARLQLLLRPNEDFSALLNLHGRSLDGSSSIFRANVFTPGSNELNGNFDRDRVFYNQGGGNRQKYDSYGGALTLNYDFGGAELISITGYETTEGFSRGDIDGGVAGVGPGFIPFDSDTTDAIDNLDQFTQEIRLASPSEGPFTWQVGAFYFDSEVEITSSGTGTAGTATVVHENTSWALFGQGSYELSDVLTLTAGLRYTEDEKDFRMTRNDNPFVTADPTSVSDDYVSWDVSLTYEATPDINLYARAASGFRAPSIQGRDVAFQFVFVQPGVNNPQSVAQSETALSFEAGIKADVLSGTGRINADVFHYTIEDMQLTVIGGANNSNRLVNAEEGVGYGFEVEADFDITENFWVSAGLNYTHTEINDPDLLVLPCGAGEFNPTGNCTVLDPRTLITVGANPAVQAARIDGNPLPQAPEFTLNLAGRYAIPTSNGGEWFAYTDWAVRGPMNIFLYDSVEFETDTQFEGGLKLGYARQDGSYEIAIFARNITDEENVIGAIDFNNLTGFVNEPRIVGVSLNTRF